MVIWRQIFSLKTSHNIAWLKIFHKLDYCKHVNSPRSGKKFLRGADSCTATRGCTDLTVSSLLLVLREGQTAQEAVQHHPNFWVYLQIKVIIIFWYSLHFWGHLYFSRCLNLRGCFYFWGHLHFWCRFHDLCWLSLLDMTFPDFPMYYHCILQFIHFPCQIPSPFVNWKLPDMGIEKYKRTCWITIWLNYWLIDKVRRRP